MKTRNIYNYYSCEYAYSFSRRCILMSQRPMNKRYLNLNIWKLNFF